MTYAGLHPTGLQGLCLPSLKSKGLGVCHTDTSGLMDGGVYISEERSQSDPPHPGVCDRQWQWQSLLGGGGKTTSYRGVDIK